MKLKENLLDRFFVHLFNVGKFTLSSSTTKLFTFSFLCFKSFHSENQLYPPKIG